MPSNQPEIMCNCEMLLALIDYAIKQLNDLDETPPMMTLRRLFESQRARLAASHETHLHPPRLASIIPLSIEERTATR